MQFSLVLLSSGMPLALDMSDLENGESVGLNARNVTDIQMGARSTHLGHSYE